MLLIAKVDGNTTAAKESEFHVLQHLSGMQSLLDIGDQELQHACNQEGMGGSGVFGGFHACFHFSDTHGAFLSGCSRPHASL